MRGLIESFSHFRPWIMEEGGFVYRLFMGCGDREVDVVLEERFLVELYGDEVVSRSVS